MFEFGKDLRRIFTQAREQDDRTWLELIGADLLRIEARQQSIDAGRVSCRRPVEAWISASGLWREHARRTGARDSGREALAAADAARRAARDVDHRIEADLAAAQVFLLEHDLRGDPDTLDQAEALLEGVTGGSALLGARIAAAHSLIRSRRMRASGVGRLEAAALLDAALHALEPHSALVAEAAEVQLERAALTLEGGLETRDARLLDQAGRDLRELVAACSPDYRPITRARALTLCAAGLSSLATLAGDGDARAQAADLFDAAAETFTPDHSPLDWTATLLARSARRPATLGELRLAERLTAGEGVILGAMARAARMTVSIAEAASRRGGDALLAIEAEIIGRLARQKAADAPLDWVADQIGLAEARLARLGAMDQGAVDGLGLALLQAAEVASVHGCPGLALRASTLIAALTPARRV